MSGTRKFHIGEVCSGSLRAEDLIPEFSHILERLSDDHAELIKRANDLEWDEGDEIYVDAAAAAEVCAELQAALEGCAGPYFYFGSHPGDGACFGFWLHDLDEEFDGLRVDDLAAIPNDHEGEALVVNDHGNATLYACTAGREPVEIWAVV